VAEEKIAFLRRFLAERPGFKSVIFIVVRGRPVTPVEALQMLERGEAVEEIVSAMRLAGYDPRQPIEELAMEYYRRLAQIRPRFKIVMIQKGVREEISAERAVEEIRIRSPLGEKIVKSYASLLELMREKMR